MNKFKKQLELIRESIFKGASAEEVDKRQDIAGKMAFDEWFNRKVRTNELIKNEDGSYNCIGSVYLNDLGLTKIPIQFNKVLKTFDITYNKLETLIGCPKEITNGSFICSYNNLSNLIGCPIKIINGSMRCDNNQLTSLEGCPKEIFDSFDCSNNKLTSLEGCPNNVHGNFYCNNNIKKFTEDDVRAICEVEGIIYTGQ